MQQSSQSDRKSTVSVGTPSSHKAADSETHATPSNKQQEQKQKQSAEEAGPMFSIVDEEESSEIVAHLSGTSAGFEAVENPRFSTQSCRRSIKDMSEQPTRTSLNFYARRSDQESVHSRHSQLAEELCQMDSNRRLVSSQFSTSLSSSMVAGGFRPGKSARAKSKSSLLYPNVGSLKLEEFLASEPYGEESAKFAKKSTVEQKPSKKKTKDIKQL